MHPLVGSAEWAQIFFHLFYESEYLAFLCFSCMAAGRTVGANCGKSPVEVVNALSTHALGNPWVFLWRRTHPVLFFRCEGRSHAPAPGLFSRGPGE